MEPLIVFAVFLFFLLMSMVLHEIGHAGVAYLCGDRTAYDQGRITLNPIAHIDPFLTILMPILTGITMGMPFGGARPVPVQISNLRKPGRDDALVTIAGPAANVLIALFCALVYHVGFSDVPASEMAKNGFGSVLVTMIVVNVGLVLFNLLPVPPLDGHHLLALVLPKSIAEVYKSVGFLGIIILIVLLQLGLDRWLVEVIIRVMDWLAIDEYTWKLCVTRVLNIPSNL